jgi:acetyl esterase/lipase
LLFDFEQMKKTKANLASFVTFLCVPATRASCTKVHKSAQSGTRVAATALALILPLAAAPAALAQQAPTHKVELLWPAGAPGAVGAEDTDKPSLTVYPAPQKSAVQTAVIVCPGGGYGALAKDHEGDQIARWLNSLGIQAFVLQYRIAPRYHYPAPLLDAQRAIRFVRARAADYRIAPDRIGIWGFSAGGHLASTTGTHFDAGDAHAADPIDRMSSRPDFMILAYPVISFTTPYTHAGSLRNLLGDNPDPKLVASLSNETQVTAQTPPTFLFHTNEDNGVPPENSVLFYLALRKAGVPAEMHIYERGPHGVGLAATDAVLASWAGRLKDWLEIRGLLQ